MKIFSGYVTARDFDGINLPITIQHNLMRKYCEDRNCTYKLAQTELVIKNSSFVLFSILKKLKKNDNLIMCSIFMLPGDEKQRSRILNFVKKKNIKLHFVFEDLIVKDQDSFFELENFVKLKKKIDVFKPAKNIKFFKKFKSIN